jgi:putative addiction module component (TIGR02574 family)
MDPETRSHEYDRLLAAAASLPLPERIRLAQDVWDTIPEDASSLAPWHYTLLDDRLAEQSRNPGVGRTWSEVREAILRRDRLSPDSEPGPASERSNMMNQTGGKS